MVEPLSVAASIIEVLSLGVKVTQSLVEIYVAYRHQDVDIESTTSKLEDLSASFEFLTSTLEQRKFQAEEQEVLSQIERSIKSCAEIIEELQEELDKSRKTLTAGLTAKVKTIGNRVAYPFRRSSLQSLEEKILDIRKNISFAQQFLQFNDSSHIRDDIEDVKALLDLVRSSQISSELRSWLQAPDATTNHNDACAKRHPATSLWLVKGEAFELWLRESNSFLWIYGFAGCGKSVLCSTAIQYAFRHRRSNSRVGVAFFYFSFNDSSKQEVAHILRALLLQLSNQSNDALVALNRLHSSHHGGSPSVPAMIEALKEVIQKFQDVYLLIDALDESPQQTAREYVLDSLVEVLSWRLSSLHILVTSRDIPDIRERLDPFGSNISMKNEGVDKDIADFITDYLVKSPALRKWSAHHETIKEALTSRAKGVFRWVECQFKSLAQCPRSEATLKKRLASLPRSLDETYERMLLSIDEDCVEDARRILTLVCYAERPLTAAQVIDGIAVELGENPNVNIERRLHDESDILQICPGFIDISVEPGIIHMDRGPEKEGKEVPTFRIAHFSVQEYLESQRILEQNAAFFSLSRVTANEEIAQICLTYLLDPALSKWVLTREILIERPLLEYSALYWHSHLKQGKIVTPQTEKLLLRLFRDQPVNFRNSIRAYDLCSHKGWDSKDSPYILLSPLFYASFFGLDSIIIEIWKDESYKDSSYQYKDFLKQAKQLLNSENGLSLDLCDLYTKISKMSNFQKGVLREAFVKASGEGHLSTIQLLLDKGAEIDAHNGFGMTALQKASLNGQIQAAQLLLDNGADVNAQCGQRAFGNAICNAAYQSGRTGNIALMKLLLDNGADINAQSGSFCNVLCAALRSNHGYIEPIKFLLSRGAQVNAQCEELSNALYTAYQDDTELVQLLLDNGAAVNAQGGSLGNALQAASYSGFTKITQLLLDNGAEVNTQGGFYGNALQAASFMGRLEVVQLLIDHGANVNAQCGIYGNALQAASGCNRGRVKIVQLLLDNGAEVNAQGGDYGSALQAASSRGALDVVQLLLDHGADVNAQGGEHGNALQAATKEGHHDIAELLASLGALPPTNDQ